MREEAEVVAKQWEAQSGGLSRTKIVAVERVQASVCRLVRTRPSGPDHSKFLFTVQQLVLRRLLSPLTRT